MAPGREGTDLFRTAQAYFDTWGRLRPAAGPAAPDIMHWTYPLPLRIPGRPNVYTVHDLIPLLHPGLTGIDGPRMRRLLARIAAAAAQIVTVSEATRQELLATLRLPPHRVTNTWQAVDVDTPGPHLQGLEPQGYFLHVGTVELRKNVDRVVAAWRASGTTRKLVVAGPDGFGASRMLQGAGDVVRLPWPDRAELLALLRDARALLMPSLAEGFGLPVVEAMALGTPVLTSTGGALEEVAGGAASLVDPRDVHAIAAAIARLDTQPGLRAHLSAAGRARAALFTPGAYAARLAAVYEAVSAGQGGR